MKIRCLTALILLAVTLLPASPVVAAGATPAVSISEDAYVPKGQVHDGDLVAVFGDVRIEGTVTGQVVVVLGSLDLGGEVEGDVVSILSGTKIADTARIAGQLVNVGGALDQAQGSHIEGETVNVNFMRFIPFAGKGGWAGVLRALLIIKLIILSVVFVGVLLAAALVPRRLSVMSRDFPRRWGWSLLVGLVTYAGVVIGTVILVCTIIGIPLAIALSCTALVIKCVGLAAILYLIGNTSGRNLFNRDLPHLSSILGGFVIYALLSLVPFFGFVFRHVMDLLAVGIVLLTRFGSERAEPPVTVPAAAPATAPAIQPS